MGEAGPTGWIKPLLLAGLMAAAPSIGAPPVPAPTESQRFAVFLEEVYQRELKDFPQRATEFGAKTGDDRWDDLSERALAERAAHAHAGSDAARTQFDYAALDPASRLQYRVFLDEQQLLLDRYRWRYHLYALNQIVGLHIDVPGLLTGQQRVENEDDARAYIRRIRAVRPAFRQLEAQMRAQARRRIYIPQTVYPLLIEEAKNVIVGAPHDGGDDSPIYADFKRRLQGLPMPTDAKARLLAEARTALVRDLQPAYENLIRLLKAQAARSPVTGGVWQLPDGDAFYAFLIRQFTTTDMTPADIHALGLAEVARLQAEIGDLMKRVGFTGSVREFMVKTKGDSRNYASNDDAGRAAYLAKARGIVAAMNAKITEAFEAPAPLPLQILRTEAYKEASSPPGFYEAGSADGSRPGTVYLNLSDMRVLPLYELEDLLYHEGIPGHHLQISTILVDRSIPQLRKVNEWWQDSAFVEGWGLYAERLGKDLGFYQDPYAEFGLLAGELWRASRLVVDSGLHYKRWTRAQAIQYLNENTPSPEDTNVHAVDRYLAVPGQATSFMVGMRRFVAERERAQAALGSRFDLRQYHRVALSSGYIPLWALHEKVSDWIEETLRQAETRAPDPAFNRILEDYWQESQRLFPRDALAHGDRRDLGLFDDSLEDGWRPRILALIDRYQKMLAQYSAAALSASDATSLAMLSGELREARNYYSGPAFETARMLPIDQFQGLHTEFASDAAGAGNFPFSTVEDYDRALQRADRFAVWVDDAIMRLREGLRAQVVLPRLVVEGILPQLQPHFGGPPEKTEFWAPIANLPPTFTQLDRRRLERAYRLKIARVIQPAYRRLYNFLNAEYRPKARTSVGLGAIPGGSALYAYDVRHHTTTNVTPAEIHELGIAEVKRIEGEFAKVQAALHVDGSLADLYAHVRTDPAQKFNSRQDIVPAFASARKDIEGRLPRLFDRLPRAAFEIRALPESSKNSPGNGYYSPAAADDARPGILWINTYASGVTDRFNVMTIMLHEGLPGHHLQTSLAAEQRSLPAFRRFDATTAYGEGWALYAESLGRELGVFDDPWSYYGHLNYAILRANRLVIDTGLHAEGWDVAKAVRWMLDHSSMTPDQATAEVLRYVAYPGQALAYKLGELQIRALRGEAERALGAAFDVKAFHDQVLLGGSMPLDILGETVRRWISVTQPR